MVVLVAERLTVIAPPSDSVATLPRAKRGPEDKISLTVGDSTNTPPPLAAELRRRITYFRSIEQPDAYTAPPLIALLLTKRVPIEGDEVEVLTSHSTAGSTRDGFEGIHFVRRPTRAHAKTDMAPPEIVATFDSNVLDVKKIPLLRVATAPPDSAVFSFNLTTNRLSFARLVKIAPPMIEARL